MSLLPSIPDKATIKMTIRERVRGERRYNPHGTRRMEALAGIKLASFKHRFWAFMIDSVLILILMAPFGGLLHRGIVTISALKIGHTRAEDAAPVKSNGTPAASNNSVPAAKSDDDSDDEDKKIEEKVREKIDVSKLEEQDKEEKESKDFLEVVFGLIYYGFFLSVFNGRTPGKKWMGVRVVSLTSERVSLWQACERTLGYGASALEAGFGYVQFFIHPNRCCVHDRIAETIVIEDPPREKKAAKKEAETVKEVARLEAEEARALDEEVLKVGSEAATELTDIQ